MDLSNSAVLSDQLLDFLRRHEVLPPISAHLPLYDLFVFSLDYSPSNVRFDQIFDNVGSEAERLVRAQDICRSLCQAFQNPETHLQRLDDAISVLINFDAIDCRDAYGSAVKLACQVLARTSAEIQPYSELQKTNACLTLDDGLFSSPVEGREAKDLKVCRFFDTNTICISLVLGLNPPGSGRGIKNNWSGLAISSYIDLLAQLLRASLGMVPDNGSCKAGHLLVLRAFLWTSWQRCVMMLRWSLLRVGSRVVWAETINRRVIEVQYLRESMAAPTVQKSYSHRIPSSMCPWAFTHLRAHPAAAGANFDYFLSQYARYFGHLPARCILNSDGSYRQCKGDGPFGCNRYTGTVIRDQSAHRAQCSGSCSRLFWDEGSYRSVQGARAVDIDKSTECLLKYRTASYATVAISHVWAHGQGGRPERPEDGAESTGFNSCLHQRYSDIARRLQSHSYWIDTACIPQDHQLRREAISQINDIFATSRLTLVCDRDLMAIDIKNRNFSILESVLVAFLVCDWSLRAWTLLEGVRGAQNIHLLCKDEEIFCLGEVISAIHGSGRLSLANLCLTIDHLLSPSVPARNKFGVAGWGYREDGRSVEGAATMLRHRHASREGDDIVIWSLLCGRLAYTTEDFWRGSAWVRTGFLLSSATRMRGVYGLSWAPRRPDIAPPPRGNHIANNGISSLMFEGTETTLGQITSEGLVANWRMCRMKNSRLFSVIYRCIVISVRLFRIPIPIFWKYRVRDIWLELSYYRRMAWLSRKARQRMRDVALDVQVPLHKLALIQPSKSAASDRWDLNSRGTSLAVIESTGEGSWVWKKVLHLDGDDDILLAPFREERLVIE
jgi:hypothetical protein